VGRVRRLRDKQSPQSGGRSATLSMCRRYLRFSVHLSHLVNVNDSTNMLKTCSDSTRLLQWLKIRNTGLHAARELHSATSIRGRYLIVVLLSLAGQVFATAQRVPNNEAFERVSIGAYDPEAWNGIVFDAAALGQRLPFAIRVGSKSEKFLEWRSGIRRCMRSRPAGTRRLLCADELEPFPSNGRGHARMGTY